MKKSKTNELIQECCHRCGLRDIRKHMYHMQSGFGALWFCKNALRCARRQVGMKKK